MKIDLHKLLIQNIENPVLVFGNPSGYHLNVNHPTIRPLYERYIKEVLKIPYCFPMSDNERFDFEEAMFPYLVEKGVLKYE